MITKDNIKKLLSALGFEQDGDIFTKSYEGVAPTLKVDVRDGHFYYKEFGITVGRETTSNFSEPENFVVFECIDRLLSMGYMLISGCGRTTDCQAKWWRIKSLY